MHDIRTFSGLRKAYAQPVYEIQPPHSTRTTSIAARIGCAQSTLTRPLAGLRNCPLATALAVERATGGKVKALCGGRGRGARF
jgi:DNA-binding transcriptional regulator YdaS (Cro superfamily)